MKNRIKINFILNIIFLSVLILEGIMTIRYGLPPQEPDPVQFKEQHADIYKRFFKKIRNQNGYVYSSQRTLAKSEEFPVVKKTNTVRVFLIGGSVAEGFDDLFLKTTLEDLIPDKNFEVINCGVAGYDSYREILVLKEILSYKPDLIIVFSGNNEFNFANTINNGRVYPLAYYTNKFLRRFWIYRKAQNRFSKWKAAHGFIKYWSPEQVFVKFERNIRSMARLAKSKEIATIFCALPINIRGCPPGANRPSNKEFISGLFLLEKKDYLAAIAEFNSFLKNNHNHSNDMFGFYFLGRAYEELREYVKARKCYLMALELDVCYSGRNAIIRRVCAEEGALLAYLDSAFINISQHGLPGQEQFLDSCHWYPTYDALVSQVIIRSISEGVPGVFSSINKVESFLSQYNFISPLEHKEGQDRGKALTATVGVLNVQTVNEQAIALFEQLYLMNPGLLWRLQYLKDSIKMELKSAFIPQAIFGTLWWPRVLYHIGEAYRCLGLYSESLDYFNKAISLDEKNYLLYLGRALTYYFMEDKQKAKEDVDKAEDISRDSLEVRCYKEILKN